MAFDPQAADLSLAALFAGWAMNDEVQRRLADDGYADTRFAEVVTHLGADTAVRARRVRPPV